jgi:two-component system, OmpR family, alkaline phosphatase synthesis response regulator PhoP
MQPSSPLITRGDLQINKETRAVHLHGNDLGLTETEYDLLVFLAENPGRKFSRTELLHNVWGYTLSGYEHTVNTRINRLRTKLGDDSTNPKYILTVWGFGYQFTDAFEGESSE